MKRKTTILTAIALAGTIASASGPRVNAANPVADDEKRTFALSSVPKGGVTDEDRETAAEYLAENSDELPAAPKTIAGLAKATRLWSRECAELAQPVPKKLAKLLSTPAEGTARFLFDRALVVVDTGSNRILAWVEADH